MLSGILGAQPFARFSDNLLTLDNGIVKRVIQLNNIDNGLLSKSYSLNSGGEEFLSSGSEDFYFEADGNSLSGLNKWNLVSVNTVVSYFIKY